jgi:hypothetical protein
MKQRSFPYTLVFLYLLSFFSAKKKMKKAPAICSLVHGQFPELKEDLNNDGDLNDNNEDQLNSCVGDNVLTFHSGGELIINQGALKCDPNEELSLTGTWLLSDDEKILTLIDDTYTSALVLFSLTPNQMKLHEIEDGRIEMLIVLEK